MKTKLLCILSVLCLIAGVLSMQASALEASAGLSDQQQTLIVTLSSPSLLQRMKSCTGEYRHMREMLPSGEGQQYLHTILSEQAQLRQRILSCGAEADLTDSRSYTAVTNAITVKGDSRAAEAIRQLPGVASVTVSEACTYAAPAEKTSAVGADQAEQSEPLGMASKRDVQADYAYEAGYTGKGTLIAVIDSEFDVRHEAFSTVPEEPAFDKAYVRSIAEAYGLDISSQYSVDDLFYSDKIIYSYDYGEDDNLCRVDDSVHGTHVAGIAAGNYLPRGGVGFQGMAYDAQLALFKISDTDMNLVDEYIIAALDDAVKLGPDVINCSYGAVQYMTHDYEGRQLYENLTEAGIAVVAAAGNDAYSGYAAGTDYIPTSYATYGTLCTPSGLSGAFSVGASVPDSVYEHKIFFVFNRKQRIAAEIVNTKLAFESVYPMQSRGQSLETAEIPDGSTEIDKVQYLYLTGQGTEEELSQVDIAGKLVILNESSLSPEKILKNALKNNCYAVALIRKAKDSQLGLKKIDGDFFVYVVDAAEKDYFEQNPNGHVSICEVDTLSETEAVNPRTMAEYSSYGTRADLLLKPDITAPGDNILSALSNHNFGQMSGTSMATPCVTGGYAMMKQFVRETHKTDALSPRMEEEYIFKRLMSTASLLSYPTEGGERMYYSPRLQGAGCMDLAAAIRTDAYLSVDDARPKASLLDNADGVYQFDFTVVNESDNGQSFSLDYILQTDGYEENKDKKSSYPYVNTLLPESLRNHARVYFMVNGGMASSVYVSPQSQTTVHAVIKLDTAFISQRREIFTNGFFVDGFILLNRSEGDRLQLPFSGFCGRWEDGPVFPDNIYAENTGGFPALESTLAVTSSFDYNTAFHEKAGKNQFGFEELPSQISFGKDSLRFYLHIPQGVNATTSLLLPNIYVLRDAMDYTVALFNKEEQLVVYQNFGDIPAYQTAQLPPSHYFYSEHNKNALQQYGGFVESAPEGDYRYVLYASTVGTDGNAAREESVAFNVTIDHTAPVIQRARLEKTADNRILLHLTVTDNQLIQGVRISAVQYNSDGIYVGNLEIYDDLQEYFGGIGKIASCQYDARGRRYAFTYDLTDYAAFVQKKKSESEEAFIDDDITIIFTPDKDYSMVSKNMIAIEAVDCAYNCSSEQIIRLDAYGEVRIRLLDEHRRPLAGVKTAVNGVEYQSDENGYLDLWNLPIGTSRVHIYSDYQTTDGSDVIEFRLTEQAYRYQGTCTLRACVFPPEKSTRTGHTTQTDWMRGYDPSRYSTHKQSKPIITFPTGSNERSRVTLVYTGLLLSVAVIMVIFKRKKSGS